MKQHATKHGHKATRVLSTTLGKVTCAKNPKIAGQWVVRTVEGQAYVGAVDLICGRYKPDYAVDQGNLEDAVQGLCVAVSMGRGSGDAAALNLKIQRARQHANDDLFRLGASMARVMVQGYTGRAV